uniref:G-protein coupled receptors family 1 profile domain-containing protein n=1 Tax=Romanomermis culicivorax TaxID=13658 RepID=A0A915KS40_ROMCU
MVASSGLSINTYSNTSNLLVAANSTASHSVDQSKRLIFICVFGLIALTGFLINLIVIAYVIVKRLYRNFVSSIFIAHLSFTNAVACASLIPMFLTNLNNDNPVFGSRHFCNFQAFVTFTIWPVMYYMTTCIAGVHLLTFARIHYDQLFGLHPAIICTTAWIIGASLGLPCMTNSSIISYDPVYHYCLWRINPSGLKFLAYVILLGIMLPIFFTSYAYVRVLAIFYHAPIVFETLGIFKSRYLIFALLATPLVQVPFFIGRFFDAPSPYAAIIFMFMAFLPSINHSYLYGVSIFMMKEDDMALTSRSHKATYQAPGVVAQEL